MTAVFETPAEWQRERRGQQRAGLTLGFVPTMGALHEGHLSLVRRSRAENERTLVSIYVNPTQFDDPADLARYPRAVDSDVERLRREGVDAVLLPHPPLTQGRPRVKGGPTRGRPWVKGGLYPDGYCYRVVETDASLPMEGAHRPGHFDGMLTVVLKLLQIAAAERAYFGEKDWQQLQLVRGMADAFFLATEIVACPTVRDADGLALSSRNARLAPADRLRAAGFPRILSASASAADAMRALQAEGFDVDYVEDWNGRRCGAVRLGDVRLIDNVPAGGEA